MTSTISNEADTGAAVMDALSANTLRMLSVDQVQAAGVGHLGLPLGAAPVLDLLFREFLVVHPSEPDWINRDRFVMSAGHGSALLYSVLHLAGFDLSLDELRRFRQKGSLTPGHPEHHLTPGVDVTTGPLGQGVSNAVGMAIAERMAHARLAVDGWSPIDHYTYVLASDGDLMEGVAMEAMSLAGHLGLGKLIVLYDDNQVVLDGPASNSYSSDRHTGALRALGWDVSEPIEADDRDGLRRAIRAAQESAAPSIIRCRTLIGFGTPAAGTSAAHGGTLSAEAIARLRETIRWDRDESFTVSDEVRDAWAVVSERGQAAHANWTAAAASSPERVSALGTLERWATHGVVNEIDDDALDVVDTPPANELEPIRMSSSRMQQEFARIHDNFVGGAADLSSATLAEIVAGGIFNEQTPEARNIAFGVREHGMASIANGIALHGVMRPYVSTFMTFGTYAANPIRMAALQDLPVVFLLSHDSMSVGEDGPTHQPVELLPMLRAVPRLLVLRPADAWEARESWKIVHRTTDRPIVLSLGRTPTRQFPHGAGDSIARGAYVLEGMSDADPEIVLMSSGSELEICAEAADLIRASNCHRVRLVSVPAQQIFDAQDSDYVDSVLPPEIPVVFVESAHPSGAPRSVVGRGSVIGVEDFGISAKPADVLEHFGLTAENVARVALGHLHG